MSEEKILQFKKPTKRKKPVRDKDKSIEHEGTVLPSLKFIQRKIMKKEMEKDDE